MHKSYLNSKGRCARTRASIYETIKSTLPILSSSLAVNHLHATRLKVEMPHEGICQPRGGIKGLAPRQACRQGFSLLTTIPAYFPPIVTIKRKDLTMRLLVSHMLMAITLSFLHLGLTKTGTYALPIGEPEPKIDSLRQPSTSLYGPRPDSLRLVGREIHNADYGSDGQPQNTTYNSTSDAPSNRSDASSSAPDANSPPGKNSKPELAGEKHPIQQWRAAGAVTGDRPMTKFGHKRHDSDVLSPKFSNEATPHHDDGNDLETPPTRLARRTYLSLDYPQENSDCGQCAHYPSARTMRHAYRPKYRAVPRPGRENYSGTFYYPESLSDDDRNDYRSPGRLRPTNGAFWTIDSENRDDISGGGGSRGIRYFDPKDANRMLAAYEISHGTLVD